MASGNSMLQLRRIDALPVTAQVLVAAAPAAFVPLVTQLVAPHALTSSMARTALAACTCVIALIVGARLARRVAAADMQAAPTATTSGAAARALDAAHDVRVAQAAEAARAAQATQALEAEHAARVARDRLAALERAVTEVADAVRGGRPAPRTDLVGAEAPHRSILEHVHAIVSAGRRATEAAREEARRAGGSAAGHGARLVAEGEALAAAAASMASGAAKLGTKSAAQGDALRVATGATAGLGALVRRNQQSAREAGTLARTARDAAHAGTAGMSRIMARMEAITGSAKRIEDIIGVIDGIAFQTNILALNAAVEAARAGDQGRGFAVVASEVRALAQRSAAAAREIKTLIESGVDDIASGAAQVNEVGGQVMGIGDAIEEVHARIAEIATGSGEQSAAVDRISTALAALEAATHASAAAIERTATDASALAEEADAFVRTAGMLAVEAPRPPVVRSARMA
jgi:hypothetical protein